MRIRTFCLHVFVAFTLACSARWTRPPKVKYASLFGADTKAIFNVVDYEGVPVEGAAALVGFYMNREPGKNPKNAGITDRNGVFVTEQKSVGEINYIIQKDQYYTTFGRIDFRDPFNWTKCVEDGKWQPYGATYNLTLKQKKHPIFMNKSFFQEKIVTDVPVGFDLKKGDCVKPYGNGEVADFTFTITEKQDNIFNLYAVLTLSFTNVLDGAYMKEKDLYSDYVSVYNADTNAVYRKRFSFEYNTLDPKNKIDTSLSDKQYLVLRTRTKVNAKNEITEAHYSKIYGRLGFTHKCLTIRSYFNPTPNDTNLEFAKEAVFQ